MRSNLTPIHNQGRARLLPRPLISLSLLLASLTAFPADKKEDTKKPEPPSIALALPFAAVPGKTNKIKIRGQNLTNVTEIKFNSSNVHPALTIKSKGKAEVPKEMDAKKVGDTQLEVELFLPDKTAPAPLVFTALSANGESKPATLAMVASESLLSEKEPNNGFRDAQPCELGKTIQGTIGEAKEVDVFRLSCKAGQTLVAELQAARYGSTLDSVLTLYDERGHQLAASDDTDPGRDSTLRFLIPKDGAYLLSIMDAHDKGGATYAYLLSVRVE